MRFIITLLLLPVLGFSQTVSVLNLTTNEIVYSVYNNQIYASIPSANGSNGNSIGVINPLTSSLVNTYSIGSEPTVIAISDDGQTLYSGFSGTSTVRKFNVVNNTASIQFPIGSDSFQGPFYVEDIEVMPNHPNTIAVSRRNITSIPRHEGVAIFDEGVMRTATTPDHTGSNQIEFGDEFSLVGFNNESTEYGFRRMTINAGGVSVASVTSLYQGSGILPKFSSYGGKAYFNTGRVVDFNFSPYVAGTFADVKGPGIYDTNTDLVCFASSDSGGAITFKRYNPNTYLLNDSLPLNSSQAFGDALSITTCGSGCYAFNTANKVVIIKNYFLDTPEFDQQEDVFVITPNPASDVVSIETKSFSTSKTVSIFNALGQIVKVLPFNEASLLINVTDLSSGVYYVEMASENGKKTKKLLKN